jgi:hypothetical protein
MITKALHPNCLPLVGSVDLGVLLMRCRDLSEPANDGMYTKWKMRMGDLDAM